MVSQQGEQPNLEPLPSETGVIDTPVTHEVDSSLLDPLLQLQQAVDEAANDQRASVNDTQYADEFDKVVLYQRDEMSKLLQKHGNGSVQQFLRSIRKDKADMSHLNDIEVAIADTDLGAAIAITTLPFSLPQPQNTKESYYLSAPFQVRVYRNLGLLEPGQTMEQFVANNGPNLDPRRENYVVHPKAKIPTEVEIHIPYELNNMTLLINSPKILHAMSTTSSK